MPAKKYLSSYEAELGYIVTEISREQFDSATAKEPIQIRCKCGELFENKKEVICARLKRHAKLKCRSCVNRINSMARFIDPTKYENILNKQE